MNDRKVGELKKIGDRTEEVEDEVHKGQRGSGRTIKNRRVDGRGKERTKRKIKKHSWRIERVERKRKDVEQEESWKGDERTCGAVKEGRCRTERWRG